MLTSATGHRSEKTAKPPHLSATPSLRAVSPLGLRVPSCQRRTAFYVCLPACQRTRSFFLALLAELVWTLWATLILQSLANRRKQVGLGAGLQLIYGGKAAMALGMYPKRPPVQVSLGALSAVA